MLLSKKTLHTVNPSAYTFHVADTTAAGFGDPTVPRRMSASRRIFYVRTASARPYDLWAGDGGETFGSAGSLGRRFANPVICPPTPFGDGKRALLKVQGGRKMRHIHVRPEQPSFPNTLTEIVRAALREAALANDTASALDAAGEALCQIADIARKEQSTSTSSSASSALRVARTAADSVLSALDRLHSLLESIERLTADSDAAVADLAAMARGIVAAESHRVDVALTSISPFAKSEAVHG